MAIPKEVQQIITKIQRAGFEAYIVGGCVRDLLMERQPNDWDIATNATPEKIQQLFPKSFYENKFFTVGVQTDAQDPTLKVIEVTTFRSEAKYTDKRHPDQVKPATTIEEDLARRDFTINAIALRMEQEDINSRSQQKHKSPIIHSTLEIIDPFDGKKDLNNKLIRTVGNPEERFQEDALRLMRAIRLAATLGFTIEQKTGKAIQKNAGLLQMIAKERIADELKKIIMCKKADYGIELLREYGLLKYILPELEEGWGVSQNKHHKYTVWEHNIRSLRYAAERGYSLEVRLASLLHDVGKPRTKHGEGPNCTFYGHEVVGAKMVAQMLERLHFPKHEIEKITLLVRAHMFNYDPEVVTDASVRRLVAKVGPENIRELVQVREADRIGSGVPKAVPYRLRHFLFRVEKILSKPISRKIMKLNGNELMKLLNLKPGPRVGAILDLLFEEVLDKPENNKKEYLERRAKELNKLSDQDLAKLREKAQTAYENLLKSEEEKIKKKYRV
jgi:tRNA nucleotidyltransferase (CCA-adding enzyme)